MHPDVDRSIDDGGVVVLQARLDGGEVRAWIGLASAVKDLPTGPKDAHSTVLSIE